MAQYRRCDANIHHYDAAKFETCPYCAEDQKEYNSEKTIFPPAHSDESTINVVADIPGIGQLIGDYEVLELLASGGMGTVLKARHRLMKRIVALKLVSRDATNPLIAQMFAREIEAASRVEHRNLQTVFDAGSTEQELYLVSEFLPQGDLQSKVTREGQLSIAEAVTFIAQAASALAAVHAAEMLHRDVKPSNLLIGNDGEVRLIDFGIVKLDYSTKPTSSAFRESPDTTVGQVQMNETPAGPSHHQTTHVTMLPFPQGNDAGKDMFDLADKIISNDALATMVPSQKVISNDALTTLRPSRREMSSIAVTTMLPTQIHGDTAPYSPMTGPITQKTSRTEWSLAIGTPAYLAPEQINGSSNLDTRADIYALGCTLFNLVTGQSILINDPSDISEIFDRKRNGETRSLSSIRPDAPLRLGRLISRMTSVDPSERISSMEAVAAELARIDFEPRVFFSYRREDSIDATDRLYQSLTHHIEPEQLFLDVESIPAGVEFRHYLESAVAGCHVVLAIIGDHWFGQRAQSNIRRIDEPNDFVRHEIQFAFTNNVPVIPVLVGRAKMPISAELPEEIRALASRHAAEVRPGAGYDQNITELVRSITDLWHQSQQ